MGFIVFWQKYSCILWFFWNCGIEYFPQELVNKIKDKSISHNIFRTQDDDSIMCGFYCIAFIESMLAGKALLDYITLFSPNDYKQNDQIKYRYFKDKMSSLEFRLKNLIQKEMIFENV